MAGQDGGGSGSGRFYPRDAVASGGGLPWSVRACGVPGGVWLLTDRWQARAPLPEVVAAAVDGGVRTVLLREKDLPAADRRALARALRVVLAPVGGCLLVAGADPLGADGCHLPADADPDVRQGADPDTHERADHDADRDPYGRCDAIPSRDAGRDAHPDREPSLRPDGHPDRGADGAARARRADGDDRGTLRGWSWHGAGAVPPAVDYVTLSPVYASRSKPGYGPALGLARFAAAAAGLRRAAAPVPVVALGGVATPAQVVDCLAAGAHAVAVLGAFMRSADPAATAATLVRAARRPPAPPWTPPPARPAPARAAPPRAIPAARTAAGPTRDRGPR